MGEEDMGELQKLKDYLAKLPRGDITGQEKEEVIRLLVECWKELKGSYDESMYPSKLSRCECLYFSPPATIQFEIERHGPTVLGSIYATIQYWRVDLHDCTAECISEEKRQIGKREKSIRPKQLAKEIGVQITTIDKDSQYLDWKSDKKVKVVIGKLIPFTNQQTTTYQRRRFREELTEFLCSNGWRPTSTHNIYEKE